MIGLTLANTIKPGKRVDKKISDELARRYSTTAQKTVATATATANTTDTPLMKVVKTIVPTNVFFSISKETPDMLGLMFFTLFLGICITFVADRAAPMLAAIEGLYAAVEAGIQIVMRFAPYAVFCLLFNMTARFGFGLLASLGWFVVTVLLGLAIHMFGVYSLSLALLSRINPLEFFRRIKTVMITAFSTSSSNATLPTALRVSEENLGVPRDINSFVLTVGATANQNGTALYEGVTVLFLAQVFDSVHHPRARTDRRKSRVHRDHPGRRSHPRHVQDRVERHRRSHDCDVHRALGGCGAHARAARAA